MFSVFSASRKNEAQPDQTSPDQASNVSYPGMEAFNKILSNSTRTQTVAQPAFQGGQGSSSSGSHEGDFRVTLLELGRDPIKNLFQRLTNTQNEFTESIQKLSNRQSRGKARKSEEDEKCSAEKQELEKQLSIITAKRTCVENTLSTLFPPEPKSSKRARVEPLSEEVSEEETEEEEEELPLKKRLSTRFKTDLKLNPGEKIFIDHKTNKNIKICCASRIFDDRQVQVDRESARVGSKVVQLKQGPQSLNAVNKALFSAAGVRGERNAMKDWFYTDSRHGKETLYIRRVRMGGK